ncbi:dihydroorotate dehydrogenase [Xylographa bjoerkii]|nr:dihydroorotate dehydrogenase [Xylographa bjoerkii]
MAPTRRNLLTNQIGCWRGRKNSCGAAFSAMIFQVYGLAIKDSMAFIDPPLLNSANVWATTEEDLEALYRCPDTGAVTIRTSLLDGFNHDETIHQYCFFNTDSMSFDNESSITHSARMRSYETSSLNTLGYSPTSLENYIEIIQRIEKRAAHDEVYETKPIIFSTTGTAAEIVKCGQLLQSRADKSLSTWMMEINLSCPNIVDKPPPAYSREGLISYLTALQNSSFEIPIGIKTPPYTYQGQFNDLIGALLETTRTGKCPISFITATNTLGGCFVPGVSPSEKAINSANGMGIGGLAGAALHPLALGNVRTIRRMLDVHAELKDIAIIGVGGVSDSAGFDRMKNAGASAVAVGTALGIHGVSIFGKIAGASQEDTKNEQLEPNA